MSKGQLEGLDDDQLCQVIRSAQQIISQRADERLREQIKRNKLLMRSACLRSQRQVKDK